MLKPRLKIVATIVLLLFITAILIAAVVYGGGLLWSAIRPAPTATPSPTPTATLTPSHTATLTDTATATGTFTPTPTPTATPTPTSTPTATSTHTPLPTPTDRPTETPTGDATRTPTPERPTPTPQAIYPAPTLREPGDGAQLAGRQRFVWQWDGPSLGENHAFDLRIWSQQEEKDGRPKRGAAVPTQDTETDVDLSYVPALTDYGPGDYFWTVVVVQVGSDGITKVLGEWGEKRRFTYGGPPASTSPPPTRPAPTPVAPTPTAAPFPTSTP